MIEKTTVINNAYVEEGCLDCGMYVISIDYDDSKPRIGQKTSFAMEELLPDEVFYNYRNTSNRYNFTITIRAVPLNKQILEGKDVSKLYNELPSFERNAVDSIARDNNISVEEAILKMLED